jgi:hypothetical protein
MNSKATTTSISSAATEWRGIGGRVTLHIRQLSIFAKNTTNPHLTLQYDPCHSTILNQSYEEY